MPRALQPENCFVIFMWRAAFVCQTSRFFLWERANCSCQPRQCTGHLLPPAGVRLLLFNFHSQNKVAENRLFQFIHTEIGWICISSQNNPEIWLHSIPNPWNEQFFSWLPASSCASVCVCVCACTCLTVFVWHVCFCLYLCLCVF